jgi:DUF1365 family protein
VGLNSCLYECVIVHRRLRPRHYAFEHQMMMLYADLDELDAIDRANRLLSRERRNLYSFRDADYFPTGTAGDLPCRVRSWLRERGVDLGAAGHIRLLTLPRILGYIFNPISIYFCSDSQDTPLCAIAEVGNTFRESKLFLLPIHSGAAPPAAASAATPATPATVADPADTAAPAAAAAPAPRPRYRLRVPKHYYVSPFTDLDVCFDFDLRLPGDRLQVHIEDWDADGKLLDSHLRGTRVPLSDYQLLRFALKFPALTLKVIGLIHWHALWLALRRIRWHRKADRPDLQREVLNPTPSLRSHGH